MSKTSLIIILGPPGTGKTTLGKRIAKDLNLPFVHKDGIKELLFDKLGWSDRVWSRKVGIAITFTSYEAYTYWRQVEEEGPDYWERYASIMMHWEQLAQPVEEYHGEIAVDAEITMQ